MRTTITIDEDNARRLERLRGDGSFKEIVNRALRAGLDQIEQPTRAPARATYRLEPANLRPRRTNFDNVAEVIAEAERDDYS